MISLPSEGNSVERYCSPNLHFASCHFVDATLMLPQGEIITVMKPGKWHTCLDSITLALTLMTSNSTFLLLRQITLSLSTQQGLHNIRRCCQKGKLLHLPVSQQYTVWMVRNYFHVYLLCLPALLHCSGGNAQSHLQEVPGLSWCLRAWK